MAQAKIKTKLTDSSAKVSSGGRAESWWSGKPIKNSPLYESDQYPGSLDQSEIIKRFSIKGFEYGNWVNNNDRYDRLQATAESLGNLSRIIGTKNIGCDGMIGIAFGARGKSKALAHFEPNTFMINLTKEKGFGSLAHEYGHALDYFFGMYVDQSREYTSLVGGRTTRQYILPAGGALRKMAMQIVNEIIHSPDGKKSETYKRWEVVFGNTEYWFRRNEIFARFFEQWVRFKLDQKKIKNTFLSKKKYEGSSYLLLGDFKRVSGKMDALIKEMAAFMNNKKKTVSKTYRMAASK
ncbi:MAG: LPD1 domain-containing protein [Paludibacter sp.]|nr:LPD1 domain-containing protein [Paludibacter sp.]